MMHRYDITRDELASLLDGEPAYRVAQVWEGLYRQVATPAELTTLPKPLRAVLDDLLPPALNLVTRSESDGGETVKSLWRLDDGVEVETVLMHSADRTTVCISSQAGCAMACGFCATGQAGFDRHLTTGEIVEQVANAVREARPRRLSNVVFMGMGEPLANYEPVVRAVRLIHDELGVSARHLTMSTVGIVPGIRRLATEGIPLSLAVSLHAANDELRNELVPINKRYPIGQLLDAVVDYRDRTRRRVSFEWALINGVNDQMGDADELAELCRVARAHVNLIPLNPTPGFLAQGTPPAGVRAFRDRLVERGVNATVRRTRGTSIDAACGQLRANHHITAVTAPTRR